MAELQQQIPLILASIPLMIMLPLVHLLDVAGLSLT